jgi:hypothetical protein
MRRLNVPASRNGLPLAGMRPPAGGQAPVGYSTPTILPQSIPVFAPIRARWGVNYPASQTPPPATLPINTGQVSPVRGPVAGVSEIRPIRLAPPKLPTGPVPLAPPSGTRSGTPRSGGGIRITRPGRLG